MARSFQWHTVHTSRFHCGCAKHIKPHRCFINSYIVILLYLLFLNHPCRKCEKIHQFLCYVPTIFLGDSSTCSDRKVIAVEESIKPASTSSKVLPIPAVTLRCRAHMLLTHSHIFSSSSFLAFFLPHHTAEVRLYFFTSLSLSWGQWRNILLLPLLTFVQYI